MPGVGAFASGSHTMSSELGEYELEFPSFSAFTEGDYRFFAQSGDWFSALSPPIQVRLDAVAKATVKLASGGARRDIGP